jgi:signal peptidase II
MKPLLLLALPLYVLDQATKAWVVWRFPVPTNESHDFIPVIPGFFNLVRVHNTGMAFGLGNLRAEPGTYSPSNYVFLAIAAVALGAIGWFWKKGAITGALTRSAMALLVSGILGNVTDRLFRGYVVDFLDFNLGFMRWPSFNVADSCICVAAGLLVLESFRPQPPTSRA